MCVKAEIMILTPDEWESRRSEFNHDWLKNTYLRRLRAFLDRLVMVPDSPVVAEFLANEFSMWQGKEAEVRWLAGHLVECLSPRRYFAVNPLRYLNAETKAWLLDVTHQVWLEKNHVNDAVVSLTARINAVHVKYQEISDALRPGIEISVRGNLLSHFEAYEILCRELSSELSDIRKTIGTI